MSRLLTILSFQEDLMAQPLSVSTPILHIGERCRFGNLDWFPVWSQGVSKSREYRTNNRARLEVEECLYPDVTILQARNLQEEPLALFEGTLFSSGYQHRALTRTVVLKPHQSKEIPVVCVEKGRWDVNSLDDSYDEDYDYDHDAVAESAEPTVSNHIAPLRIRHAMRGIRKLDGPFAEMFDADEPEQDRVWQEIDRYEGVTKLGTTTNSLVDLEAAYGQTFGLERSRAIPGQTGVIIAQGGYPVWLEVFDHPDTLAERLSMILKSACLDSHDLPYSETPGRRARRFAHIVTSVGFGSEKDGSGKRRKRSRSEPNPYVMTEATTFRDTTIHLTSLNTQHALFN
jgi:hypothetical protein